MTTNDSKGKIRTFLARYIRNHELQDDEDIFASRLVNSLFAMQMVLFIEKEFHIKVENEDLDLKNFNTLNAISAFIERKASAA
ncbi:MAG: D-alanyl carrier protein [Desulfobacteraceae bacterium IS3]|nr:MAG: D-alanyl carrier protein [Desulfobacteraceae bacterium IS3]